MFKNILLNLSFDDDSSNNGRTTQSHDDVTTGSCIDNILKYCTLKNKIATFYKIHNDDDDCDCCSTMTTNVKTICNGIKSCKTLNRESEITMYLDKQQLLLTICNEGGGGGGGGNIIENVHVNDEILNFHHNTQQLNSISFNLSPQQYRFSN